MPKREQAESKVRKYHLYWGQELRAKGSVLGAQVSKTETLASERAVDMGKKETRRDAYKTHVPTQHDTTF